MAKEKEEVMQDMSSNKGEVSQIPLNMIRMDDKFNSRQFTGLDKDSLTEFAESLRVNGLINPVTVRPIDKGFEATAGFRRIKAAKMLGWKTIRAVVLPAETTEQESRIINYVENVHRGDLTTYEKAHALVGLMETGIKQTELIARLSLNLSQSSVDNLIRIYTKLDPAIKKDWADPKSKIRPHLSFANLVDIIKYPIRPDKPDQMSQEGRLRQLMGETNPAAIAARAEALASGKGGGSAGGVTKGKAAGKFVRFKRADLEALIGKLEEADVPEEYVQGVMALTDVLLGRHGGKLRYGDETVWAPEVKEKKKGGGRQNRAEKATKKKEEKKAA